MDEIEDKFDKFYKYGGTHYWKLTWEQIFELKKCYFPPWQNQIQNVYQKFDLIQYLQTSIYKLDIWINIL